MSGSSSASTSFARKPTIPYESLYSEQSLTLKTTMNHPQSDAKILVVDDSNIVRLSHQKALQANGFKNILDAEDGVSALNLLSSEKVDLIIADINMPKMDGLELLKLLREREEGTDLPVIIVSASTSVNNVLKAVKLQATFVLTKPVTPEQLNKHVEQALSKSIVEINSEWKVVVADPLPSARKVLRKLLADIGLEQTFNATTVEELEACLEKREIDLVIVDRSLVEGDLTALSGVLNKSVPILLTSADSQREHVIQAAELGIQGFLGKPFGVQTLKQKILSLLSI